MRALTMALQIAMYVATIAYLVTATAGMIIVRRAAR